MMGFLIDKKSDLTILSRGGNVKKSINDLQELLSGKFSHLSIRQLLDVHTLLTRVQNDANKAAERFAHVAQSPGESIEKINRRLRAFNQANESVKILGGSKAIRQRIKSINQELRRRLTAEE
jgi:hypothetical protein